MNKTEKEVNWLNKFRAAFVGIGKGVQGESSFYVHIPVAILVIGLAIFLQLDAARFGVLLVCVTVVIVAELFNSCIERLAKAITTDQDANIGDALDIASGAVLAATILVSIVGILVLAPPMIEIFSGGGF